MKWQDAERKAQMTIKKAMNRFKKGKCPMDLLFSKKRKIPNEIFGHESFLEQL
jgi:hypothetical protein